CFFFFSSRRRHTRSYGDWSSDVCSSDLEVLPPTVRARLSVEAASSVGWERWIGDEGASVSLDHFGASAPGARVMAELGFTADNRSEERRVGKECRYRGWAGG